MSEKDGQKEKDKETDRKPQKKKKKCKIDIRKIQSHYYIGKLGTERAGPEQNYLIAGYPVEILQPENSVQDIYEIERELYYTGHLEFDRA